MNHVFGLVAQTSLTLENNTIAGYSGVLEGI